MALPVNTEESTGHTKHIITVEPQLQAAHLYFFFLSRHYMWQEEGKWSF